MLTAGGREDQVGSTDERGGPFDTTRVDVSRVDAERVDDTRIMAPDGDDIVVLPDTDRSSDGPSRRRSIIAGAAIVAFLVVVAIIAIGARRSDTPHVQTSTPAARPPTPIVAKLPPTTVGHKHSVPASTVAVTTVPQTSPRTTPDTAQHVVPPDTVPAPAPTTVASPKQYGASALTWSGARSLTIASGAAAALAVTAHNGTDGTVTLPHPLSCTPRLDHGEMCAQVVQSIDSGQSASATYTIDASGIAAGHYTLSIEGVLSIAVTVTK